MAIAAGALQLSGGAFPLTADATFGGSFGLQSLYYKSNTANIASAGVLRLASVDAIDWRNNANGADIALGKDSSDNLQWNATKILLSGAVVNADINASAAIAYSKLNLTGTILNADVNTSAAIAVSKLAALGLSKAVATDGSGFLVAATTTATELGFVSGVTSAIQTQLNGKQASGTYVTSVSGTSNQIASTGGTTPVLSLASPMTTPGAVTVTGNLTFTPTTAGHVGTTTNDNAASSVVGEYVIATSAQINLPGATTAWGDITSIALTAGDWDVTLVGYHNTNGATANGEVDAGIGTVSGNTSPGTLLVDWSPIALMTATSTGFTFTKRLSLSGSATAFAKIKTAYTVANPQVACSIFARRRR